MVASTVSKLSTLLDSPISDEQAQRLGYETILPLRESHGPTLFCFHPASGFAWQFSVLALSQPALVNHRHPVSATRRANAAVRRSGWRDWASSGDTAQEQPRGPYYLLGYSLGAGGSSPADEAGSTPGASGEEIGTPLNISMDVFNNPRAVLDNPSHHGAVYITSYPNNCEVYINNRLIKGKTPTLVCALKEGSNLIRVQTVSAGGESAASISRTV